MLSEKDVPRIERDLPLIGIHLSRKVGVRGNLPTAEVDRLQFGLDLHDGVVSQPNRLRA